VKIIGEIPARYGSRRVKNKNLRMLNGKPMIAYAIEAAKGASLLSDVYVNTESDVIGAVAEELGVKYYRRSPELASDTALQEEFNYDFIRQTGAEVLVMVNPVSPLVTAADIDAVVRHFLDHDFDTLITVEELRQQAFCDGKPVNIDPTGFLQPTQSIPPIHLCAWSVTVWKASTFIRLFETEQCGAFGGKLGFYPLPRETCLKVSYESDFRLAEMMLRARAKEAEVPRYYQPASRCSDEIAHEITERTEDHSD